VGFRVWFLGFLSQTPKPETRNCLITNPDFGPKADYCSRLLQELERNNVVY
jgi:hypothetical protein